MFTPLTREETFNVYQKLVSATMIIRSTKSILERGLPEDFVLPSKLHPVDKEMLLKFLDDALNNMYPVNKELGKDFTIRKKY